MLTEITVISIRFEERCQRRLFSSCTPKHCLRTFVGIEYHHMLARKMDLKTDYVWTFFMEIEVENPPCSFARTNISAIEKMPDLIVSGVNLHSCAIVALEDVFMDVLD